MTEAAKILELAPEKDKANFAQSMASVRSGQGKNLASQVLEIARLARGEGKLTPEEYFDFRLYDDALYSAEEKKTFIGKNGATKIYQRVVSPYFLGMSHDKLIAGAILRGTGLPSPEILAVYHRNMNFGALPVLRSPDALADYLRSSITYPCFSKPVHGRESRGVAHLEAYDAENDSIILKDKGAIPLADFAEEIEKLHSGAIFQELLLPHPELAKVCGDRVNTIRTITLIRPEGATIFRTLWKIAANGNIADNFWRRGNMMADIASETGEVKRLIRGKGPELEEFESHPETGAPIVGMTLPDWDRVAELSKNVALLFPHVRIIACDIAITDRGPLVVEFDAGGDMALPQIASGRGMMDDQFRAFLAETGKYELLDVV